MTPPCIVTPVQGMIGMGDAQHVDSGLWAIDTVNPNAWPGFIGYLRLSSADMVVGQELKRIRGQELKAAEDTAKNDKWNLAINPCVVSEVGGRSAGGSVACRSHIGMTTPHRLAAIDL